MGFKVGDWVISNNQALKVEAINDIGNPCIFDGTWLKEIGTHELWQPKESEWCWFKDERNTIGTLVQLVGIEEDGTYYGYTSCGIPDKAPCVEPFIGELPSFLKDK